jgi:excisionase family DNA binding protein
MDQLLTVKQAAQQLACEESTIRKWLSQGRLPRVKVGRLTRLRARDVSAVVEGGLPKLGPFTGHASRRKVADATLRMSLRSVSS